MSRGRAPRRALQLSAPGRPRRSRAAGSPPTPPRVPAGRRRGPSVAPRARPERRMSRWVSCSLSTLTSSRVAHCDSWIVEQLAMSRRSAVLADAAHKPWGLRLTVSRGDAGRRPDHVVSISSQDPTSRRTGAVAASRDQLDVGGVRKRPRRLAEGGPEVDHSVDAAADVDNADDEGRGARDPKNAPSSGRTSWTTPISIP